MATLRSAGTAGDQRWIFNINTSGLWVWKHVCVRDRPAGGSMILFQFGLR